MKRRRIVGGRVTIEKETGQASGIVDASVLIALLSALGYFVAYSYKQGYMHYYGVNEVLLSQINLSHVLLAMSGIGTSIFSFYSLYFNIDYLLPDIKNPIWKQFRYRIFLPVIIFGLIMSLSPDWTTFKVFGTVLLLWIAFVYGFPFLSYSEVKGYKNKLSKQIQYDDKNRLTANRFMSIWRNSFSKRIFSILSLFFICYYFANTFGLSQAEKQEEYLLLKDKNKEFLVLDTDGDNFIIAPVNLKKRQIEESFQIIDKKSELNKPSIFKKVIIKDGVAVGKTTKY